MPRQPDISVRVIHDADVGKASEICRLAFGTFLGVPDPMQVFGDREMMANRWRAHHERVLGAYVDDELVGSNVLSKWGTFGWFGPLTVRPDYWDRGIAKRLMEPTMELFSQWGTTHQGLFTFPNSPRHLGLYEKFGFNARFLTPVMKKQVNGRRRNPPDLFSDPVTARERTRLLKEVRELTDGLYPGLDLTDEILDAKALTLGDTVLLRDDSLVVGFAICHAGPNTEGGSGNCYVKFGAVMPGVSTEKRFQALLSEIERYAANRKLGTIEAGVNMGRKRAYQEMMGAGFRSEFTGVAMQKPDDAAFNSPGVFAMDDWR